jgi:hypothetical protein
MFPEITFVVSFLVFLQIFLSDPCAAQCTATTQNACLNETCCGGGVGATCQFTAASGMCFCPSTACCPRDCRVSSYTPWSPCSPSCGDNMTMSTRTRTRTTVVTAACGGAACPALRQTNQCNVSCCPQNCTVGQWSTWTGCSVECGNGTRSRRRSKRTQEACGGTCPAGLFQSSVCVGEGEVECEWAPFSAWSDCSVTCGIGTRQRQRARQRANACDGECHGLSTDTASCVLARCEGDCELNQWSEWAPCSAECGDSADGGVRARNRTFVKSLAYTASVGCHATMSELEECNQRGALNCVAINNLVSSGAESGSSLALALGLGITGALVLILVIVAVAVFVFRRRKRASRADSEAVPASPREQYAGIRFRTTDE